MRGKQWIVASSSMCLAAYLLLLNMQHGLNVRAASGSAGDASVVVVELFTSEGCSSCPPADDLLRQVAAAAPTDGQTIVALSEHVTYWNNLGWADPFSQQLFTDRQARYVLNLGVPEAYTPQMVVNGRLQIVGSDRQELARALHDQSKREAVPVTITNVERNGSDLALRLDTGGRPLPDGVEVWVALTDDSDVSQVSRGENGGRSLRHVAVVRSLVRVGANATDPRIFHISLPSSIVAAPAKAHHVVVLAQRSGQGEVVGAVTHAF